MYNNINITEGMAEELDDYQRLAQDEPKDEVLVSDTMGQDLAKLYRKGQWTDVTLAVRERRFNAHRLILSTRSTYFKNLFESEPDKLLFDLDAAFNPVAFELVLEYLYSATAVVSRKLADDVTEIALKLEIKSLTDALAGFSGTKLSKENVLQEIQRYFGKNKAALEHCLRYLDHHIDKIGIDNPQLLTMPVEIMNEIVKRQTLGVHEEADVLRLLVNWKREQLLNNDAEVVQKQATQLAQHLKLHLLHPESFFQTLKPTGWFSTEVLWDTLTELINSDRGYPIRSRDNDDPKYTARKPGPKKLKPKRKNGVLQPNDVPVAMLGYEASGKTTVLYKLKLGEVVTTIPTIGFNVESVEYRSTKFTITDCGARVKNTWMDVVSPRTGALIWVVDSNDRDTDLLVEGVELKEIFDKFGKPDMPLLVIANKQDLPNARSVAEICELMGLKDLGIKKWYIQGACATTGDGLYEGLEWFHHQIEDDE